ncbi:Gfo/Idh/MocA family protein [Paenibacillus thalictri]|uniref:Gfo/Idh/MocA family oxidoreductase n=1 Tax=Paenibacillus thalictri TaxID=2527873 RepID=A0A4Q9DN30_9BACL|nr:Gfo/Idh/MocA family oxidoreductase [Paenibacillus thalictri]TBL77340.1 Gfo/Idh/MocA family oxidoreductase [Paenibacillus thalictri]
MNTKMFSIIGCRHAHISMFINEMLELGYSCAGVYDADEPSLANKLSDQFSIPRVSDPDVLLSPKVQIVGSSAINSKKIDIIETCERHGKHIMLDKPIVTCRDDFNRLEALFKRSNIEVGMLLVSRQRKSIYTLKQMMDAGELGEITSITMRKPHKLSPATRHPWHFSKEQNGGIIIDLLIHDFDLLRWLTGREVIATTSLMGKHILPEYPRFYDTAAAQVCMEGNLIAQLYADWHTPEQCWAFGDCRIFVTGTKGSVELRLFGDPAVSMEQLLFKMTHQEKFRKVELLEAPYTVVEDFIHRVEGKSYEISHQDLLLASKGVIEADEQAVIAV